MVAAEPAFSLATFMVHVQQWALPSIVHCALHVISWEHWGDKRSCHIDSLRRETLSQSVWGPLRVIPILCYYSLRLITKCFNTDKPQGRLKLRNKGVVL